ncbi:MAG: ATP-binding protein, partial [Nitrospirae bacterium]|nr:ATP-binding protein [Nitrospirota bacterium]
FRHPRGLDKSLILTLASCHWIRNHQNVILTGPTGIGKSYIAEALVNKACCEGFTAICNKSTKLFRELEVARGDGSYSRYLSKMAKTNILVIEDWGFETLNDTQRVDLFEVIEDRHGIQSTIMISQYPVADWHNFVGEPTIADAILDRIVHNAHKISLQGESMRKTRAALTQSETLKT